MSHAGFDRQGHGEIADQCPHLGPHPAARRQLRDGREEKSLADYADFRIVLCEFFIRFLKNTFLVL